MSKRSCLVLLALVVSMTALLGTTMTRLAMYAVAPSLPSSTTMKESNTTPAAEYHVIFSTGCSPRQDWQSYVFFYSAWIRQQPGTITRIVSGCTQQQQDKLQQLFDEQIATMVHDDDTETTPPHHHPPGGRFRIHFTPNYANLKPGVSYYYWNKPFGVQHWMEHVLGFPTHPVNEHAIVMLLDPDQIIVRPFRNNDFSLTTWARTRGRRRQPRWTRVDHGKPMGQLYGYHLAWKQYINVTAILPPGESSPIFDMSDEEALEGYVVGPPYIATARDMYQIVLKWTEFALPVHDQYPELLGEMFAYSLAAAHLKLSHQMAASFMVSDVRATADDEGWSVIDTMDESTVCQPHNIHLVDNNDELSGLPYVLHYCQEYSVGYYYFFKYYLSDEFLTCQHALFREPPVNVMALSGNESILLDGTHHTLNPLLVKRNAYMTCQLIRALNAAAEYYKSRHCAEGTSRTTAVSANWNKTFAFHPADKFARE